MKLVLKCSVMTYRWIHIFPRERMNFFLGHPLGHSSSGVTLLLEWLGKQVS